jgi:DNA-directed RNA polymerase specialized sigma24 family protein
MEEMAQDYLEVRRAASCGARTVTSDQQVVEDSAVRALEQWEDALLRRKSIGNMVAWAFRVGANAAKCLLRRKSAERVVEAEADLASARSNAGSDAETEAHLAACKKTMLANLARRKNLLRGRQLEVLAAMAEPGVTQRHAAKSLLMDHSNFRRALKSALARLRQAQK